MEPVEVPSGMMKRRSPAKGMMPMTPIGYEELTVDPELTGLLLGQGVGVVRDAERAPGGAAVAAAEVIALAPSAGCV